MGIFLEKKFEKQTVGQREEAKHFQENTGLPKTNNIYVCNINILFKEYYIDPHRN